MPLHDALAEAEDKLDKFLNKESWTMEVHKEQYPITFIFRKGFKDNEKDLDGQQTIDSEPISLDEESNPEIRIIFREDMEFVMNVPDDKRIDDKFLNTLKNLAKEVHRLYLLYWFSMKEIRLDRLWTPMWETCNGDRVGILDKHYEP